MAELTVTFILSRFRSFSSVSFNVVLLALAALSSFLLFPWSAPSPPDFCDGGLSWERSHQRRRVIPPQHHGAACIDVVLGRCYQSDEHKVSKVNQQDNQMMSKEEKGSEAAPSARREG